MSHDPVTNPSHYVDRVPGIECREVAGYFPYFIGNAIKYLWRAGAKDDAILDLRKAIQSIEFEIERLAIERSADELCAVADAVSEDPPVPFVGVEQVRPQWVPPVPRGDNVSISWSPVGIGPDSWTVHDPNGSSHPAVIPQEGVRWHE